MQHKFKILVGFLLFAGTACTSNLPEDRLQTDMLNQSYVKNCQKQGLIVDAELIEQQKTEQGQDAVFVLHFEGEHTAKTRALLCDKNMGATLKYTYKDGQAVLQRMQLQPTRRQLSVLRGG